MHINVADQVKTENKQPRSAAVLKYVFAQGKYNSVQHTKYVFSDMIVGGYNGQHKG